jgi:hypothetical protein
MWVEKSLEQLDLLRTRDLTSFDCLCVMIDGVWLNRETCVVVAIGVGLDGVKQVLDFEQGSAESKAVVADLIHRLAKRGLIEREDRRRLVVRDGSAAIAGAVAKGCPAAMPQECLVHGHQNLKKKLRKRDLADLDRLMTRLREAQGRVAGEVFENLTIVDLGRSGLVHVDEFGFRIDLRIDLRMVFVAVVALGLLFGPTSIAVLLPSFRRRGLKFFRPFVVFDLLILLASVSLPRSFDKTSVNNTAFFGNEAFLAESGVKSFKKPQPALAPVLLDQLFEISNGIGVRDFIA